jgi:hypothetical protein
MNSQITSKFAAFGVALMLNLVLLGGVGYVFDSEAQRSTGTLALAQAWAPTQAGEV